jgi:glycosyltransferase involved in cell wall biosynthesis
VRPGDDGELAGALLRLLKSEDLRLKMGEAGRARAASLFDVRRTVAQVQELYEELLGLR